MAYQNNDFDDCTLVYFCVESADGPLTSDLVQIAACEEYQPYKFSFCEYIRPTHSIHPQVTAVNGFEFNRGQLYHEGEEVPAVNVHDALGSFLEYLQGLQQPVVLAGHNAHYFHAPLLMNTINKLGMADDFEDVVYGFLDTLKLLKNHHANSNFIGKYKIWNICRYHRVAFDPDSKTAEDKVQALEGIMQSMRRRCERNDCCYFPSSIEEFVNPFSQYC